MRTMEISQNRTVTIDEADFEFLSSHKWHYDGRYAVANSFFYEEGKRRNKKIYMHRMLMPGVKQVDHSNGDKLDNRRANLRSASRSQNMANRGKMGADNTSKYKGVFWHKKASKWAASITVLYKNKHLGLYLAAADAARAYDVAAIKYFGEFAKLNEAA